MSSLRPMHPEPSTSDSCNFQANTPTGHRRDFLKATAGLLAFPTIVPSRVFGEDAPSNRVVVGCIGLGNQGTPVMQRFLRTPGVQVVAVCDVNRGSGGYKSDSQFLGREPARRIVEAHYAEQSRSGRLVAAGCTSTGDFRELLGRDDIDAVTVVTPDHWHAAITIAACRAGKDVYCEKPLSLTVDDGRAMVRAVREHQRVLQTGSQERSNARAEAICRMVREGKLGELRRVVTNVGTNNKVGPGPGWSPKPVPEGFDYDFWLGPAPEEPYHPDRCLYRFRFLYDYSGGQITNFGAHSNDLAQWGLDADRTGPIAIESLEAEFPEPGSLFDTALRTRFRCRYANGVELLCQTASPAVQVRFECEDGWIETGYGGTRASREEWLTDLPEPDRNGRSPAENHVLNFVECVRTRRDPVAPVEVGHRSATLCHLGVIASRLGPSGELAWDPQAERFLNSEPANAYLERPMRSPWTLA